MPEPLKPTDVGFGTPWADQIAFLRDKLQLPSERWDDIGKGANDKAIIFAGAMKADLVNDLHQAVLTTAEAGGSERDFQKQFEQIVAKHGWTGWTGEGSAAGTAWRAGIIYQTNMATSYAAGRWRQLMDPAFRQLAPYWRYNHADGVAHPRPAHVAWHGVTLRWDHEFWQTHFCPNGWRCHCWVNAVAKPGPGDKTEPPAGWDKVSEATGAPVGIDRGWDYAPGAARHLELQEFIDAKLIRLDGPIGDALRQHVKPVLEPTARKKPETLDEYIVAGREVIAKLPAFEAGAAEWHTAMFDALRQEVRLGTPAKLASTGQAASAVKEASRLYPAAWVERADRAGPLFAKATQGRAFALTLDRDYPGLNLPVFGLVRDLKAGHGYITVRTGDVVTAVHEYGHRLQKTVPGLDDIFQELHRRRVANDPVRRIRDVGPRYAHYGPDELTREDHYVDAYQGREYKVDHGRAQPGGAHEVLTMAFEAIVGAASPRLRGRAFDGLTRMFSHDREMVELVLGLLFKFTPA